MVVKTKNSRHWGESSRSHGSTQIDSPVALRRDRGMPSLSAAIGAGPIPILGGGAAFPVQARGWFSLDGCRRGFSIGDPLSLSTLVSRYSSRSSPQNLHLSRSALAPHQIPTLSKTIPLSWPSCKDSLPNTCTSPDRGQRMDAGYERANRGTCRLAGISASGEVVSCALPGKSRAL